MENNATKLDFQEIRKDRQKYNNFLVIDAVKSNDEKKFYKNINKEEYKRTLEDLKIDHKQFWEKCKIDHLFLVLSARNLAKKDSRQGSKDELVQIKICNEAAQKCNIKIKNLNNKAFRPTKQGKIVSFSEMEKKKISKDQCLKSFDAKITGKMKGWLSAKITYGNGGHQDNVFEEEDTLCSWWKNNMKNKDQKLVILIDTDLKKEYDTLKTKYKDCKSIIITNHYQFQEYLLKNYSKKNQSESK